MYLAASNLLLPLLIHQQPLRHPCSSVCHLGPTHSLISDHLVDRSKVLGGDILKNYKFFQYCTVQSFNWRTVAFYFS